MKAGPPAATFDIEVTFGMECMHRRAQNPTSLGPEVGADEGVDTSLPSHNFQASYI